MLSPRVLVLPAAAFALACVDSPEQIPTKAPAASSTRVSQSVTPVSIVTYDDMLEAIAKAEPTFAGVYFKNGVLHVALTDVRRNPGAVRRAITSVFHDRRLGSSPMSIDPATYSFGQLANWGRLFPRVSAVVGVVSTDIDEVNNKLSIGVTSDAAGRAAIALLTSLKVPGAAISVHPDEIQTALLTSGTSLGGVVRNTLGGVHMDTNSPANFCTLGLNVSFNGQASFMTDGHCTNSWGFSNDGTSFWQASRTVSAELAGSEGTESRTFGPATDSRCTGTYLCKWSDATFVPYSTDFVAQQSMGYFARTTSRTLLDSNLVIDVSNPTIPITNKTLFPFAGDIVDKVGARTGWTYGQVTGTCVTIYASNANGQVMQFVCMHTASGGAKGGDSGAGVFVYDQTNGNASWAGQLISGANFNGQVFTTFSFASLNNIQSEFGNVPATIYGQ